MRKILVSLLTVSAVSLIILAVVKQKPHPAAASIYRVINPNKPSLGTGFAIKDSKGRKFIVTNHHVCALGGVSLSNFFYVEREEKQDDLKIVGHPVIAAPEADLCIIAAEGIENPLELSTREPVRGEVLTTLGHPGGGPMVQQEGRVISILETIFLPAPPSMCGMMGVMTGQCARPQELGVLNIIARPGQSGSPVLDKDNKVVGIINSTDSLFSSYYIPTKELLPLLFFLENYLE